MNRSASSAKLNQFKLNSNRYAALLRMENCMKIATKRLEEVNTKLLTDPLFDEDNQIRNTVWYYLAIYYRDLYVLHSEIANQKDMLQSVFMRCCAIIKRMGEYTSLPESPQDFANREEGMKIAMSLSHLFYSPVEGCEVVKKQVNIDVPSSIPARKKATYMQCVNDTVFPEDD